MTRASRSTQPRCLHFATSRIEFERKYPGYFFCNKCDNVYDDFILTPKSNYKRNIDSRTYKCLAKYDNFISPSQLKSKSFILKNDDDDDIDDIDDTNSVCDSTYVETNRNVNRQKYICYADRKSLYT